MRVVIISMILKKVERFIRIKNLLSHGDTVIVAVSGGPDSLCLLHLLVLLSKRLKLRLIVAHLNHCLRPEAVQEANGVAAIAAGYSLAFVTRTVDIREMKRERKISEEEAGRLARYDLLLHAARKYGASKIALGHHLDDQAETVLLNILRGTGPDGLAGILPIKERGGVQMVRPLLCLRRSEIEIYCRENNLQPYTDSSNMELDYTRNKLRLELIPRLEKHYNPKIREALFGLASLAAADRALLQKLAVKHYRRIAAESEGKTTINREAFISLPASLQGRIARLALLKHIPAGQINRLQINRLIEFTKKGSWNKLLVLPGGINASCLYKRLSLYAGTAEREKRVNRLLELTIPGRVVLPGGEIITAMLKTREELRWPPASYQAYIDFDLLSPGKLVVCFRQPGERFHPQGSAGSKKLKDFLIDQKVPVQRRNTLPLVKAGEEIIWVAGIRVAHPYRVTDKTKRVLVLEKKVARRQLPVQ